MFRGVIFLCICLSQGGFAHPPQREGPQKPKAARKQVIRTVQAAQVGYRSSGVSLGGVVASPDSTRVAKTAQMKIYDPDIAAQSREFLQSAKVYDDILFPNDKTVEPSTVSTVSQPSPDDGKSKKAMSPFNSTKVPGSIPLESQTSTQTQVATNTTPDLPPAIKPPPQKPPSDPLQDKIKPQQQDENGCWAYATAAGVSALLKQDVSGQKIRQLAGNLDEGGEPSDTKRAADKLGLKQEIVYSESAASKKVSAYRAEGIEAAIAKWIPGHVQPAQFYYGSILLGDNNGQSADKVSSDQLGDGSEFFTVWTRKK